MEQFNDTIFTQQGKNLLVKVDAGSKQLTYTKAVMYAQDVNSMGAYDITQLKSLNDQIASTNIYVTAVVDNTITINATFDNSTVTSDLTFNSIGWFAKAGSDGDEILFAITPTKAPAVLIAGLNGHSTASISVDLSLAVDDSRTVNLTPSEQGTVTPAYLQAEVTKILQETGGSDKARRLDDGQDFNTVTDGRYFIPNASNTYLNAPESFDAGANVLYDKDFGPGVGIEQLVACFSSTESTLTLLLRHGKYTKSDKSDLSWLSWQKLTDLYTSKSEFDEFKSKIEANLRNEGTVKTVNGHTPDVSGNVDITDDIQTQVQTTSQILTGVISDLQNRVTQLDESAVKSVQNQVPDSTGNVSLPQITYLTNLNGTGNSTETVDDKYGAFTVATEDSVVSAIKALAQIYLTQTKFTNIVNLNAPLYRKITANSSWFDILGAVNGAVGSNLQALVSFRDDTTGGNTIGGNASGIAFGGGDTKGAISVSYSSHTARVTGGNGDSPTWHEDMAWKSDFANYYNKTEIDQKITDLQNQVKQLQDKLNSLVPFIIVTQAQFDKLTIQQKQSGVYGISG